MKLPVSPKPKLVSKKAAPMLTYSDRYRPVQIELLDGVILRPEVKFSFETRTSRSTGHIDFGLVMERSEKGVHAKQKIRMFDSGISESLFTRLRSVVDVGSFLGRFDFIDLVSEMVGVMLHDGKITVHFDKDGMDDLEASECKKTRGYYAVFVYELPAFRSTMRMTAKDAAEFLAW